TLRLQPRDWRCKTRGQDGSLLLSCETLSFSTPCRFIPAHNEPNLPQPLDHPGPPNDERTTTNAPTILQNEPNLPRCLDHPVPQTTNEQQRTTNAPAKRTTNALPTAWAH